MAVEYTFETIENYLSGKMSAGDRQAFEQRLTQDAELQREVNFQRQLIEGIRKARITELKTMLNQVPVTPVSVGGSAVVMKIISSVIAVGIIGAGIYWYISQNENTSAPEAQPEVQVPVVSPAEQQPLDEPQPAEPVVESVPDNTRVSPTTSTESKTETVTPATKPALQVYEPENEDNEQAQRERDQLEMVNKAFVTSSIEVTVEDKTKKTNFHYAFSNNKLVLYGQFEKDLYEILEFIAQDKRTVFLYYKSNYYLLDLTKSSPTVLVPIQNAELLRKLKESRSN
jgi:hypothetical protein